MNQTLLVCRNLLGQAHQFNGLSLSRLGKVGNILACTMYLCTYNILTYILTYILVVITYQLDHKIKQYWNGMFGHGQNHWRCSMTATIATFLPKATRGLQKGQKRKPITLSVLQSLLTAL